MEGNTMTQVTRTDAEERSAAHRTRILYVRKNYDPRNLQRDNLMGAETRIIDELGRHYSVSVAVNLREEVIGALREALLASAPFSVMVTHVHPSRSSIPREYCESDETFFPRYYAESLDLLGRIKKAFPHLSIIAYTGADNCRAVHDLFKRAGIGDIVHVSRPEEWQRDCENIERAVGKCLGGDPAPGPALKA
jgi:hypothetical protein